MAERNISKPRTPRLGGSPSRTLTPQKSPPAKAAPRPEPSKALASSIARLESSVLELKRERDALAAELATAKAEIVALDTARRDAIDRINWVIDSLSTALDVNP